MERIDWISSVFVFSICFAKCVTAEVLTDLPSLEKILNAEVVLVETLNNYVVQQEAKLEFIKTKISLYVEEHEKSNENVFEYLTNPLNVYLLVKRITIDRNTIEECIKEDTYGKTFESLTTSRNDINFPNEDDFRDTVTAFLGLQHTYNLDTGSLAAGNLNGIECNTHLSCDDCFELGLQSYKIKDYHHSASWMHEALWRSEINRNNAVTFKSKILEYFTQSLYMIGNLQMANHFTKELLMLNPNHDEAKKNLARFKQASDKEAHLKNEKVVIKAKNRTTYQLLCNRDIQLSVDAASKLKCRYVHNNNPFLLIAPMKEEEANLKPRILLYHDVIYEDEIETIKRIALPQLTSAKVLNQKTGDHLVKNDGRASKLAWLDYAENPTIAAVRRRVGDMTGLSVETAENMQVVNYGIGGFYKPHYDFFKVNNRTAMGIRGDRIATVLFYLNDVSQGGATVFPRIKVAVWPKKGSALFWLNLHSSGEEDYDTLHAACPVLQGTKWISNYWLHEYGQEFLRPCDPADAVTVKS